MGTQPSKKRESVLSTWKGALAELDCTGVLSSVTFPKNLPVTADACAARPLLDCTGVLFSVPLPKNLPVTADPCAARPLAGVYAWFACPSPAGCVGSVRAAARGPRGAAADGADSPHLLTQHRAIPLSPRMPRMPAGAPSAYPQFPAVNAAASWWSAGRCGSRAQRGE